MPKEWYVSFHGGEEQTSLNNIHVYSTDGKKLRKALNKKSLSESMTLRELRGFVFGPDGNLYVVNAYFEYSEVLKFTGALNKDGQHNFAGVFVKRHPELNPGIDHPFNIVFDSNGDLYVSSQNTSLVARYHGPAGNHGQPGRPMPFPQSLDPSLNLPPGTFVPSAKHASNGLVEAREAIFMPGNSLYVADRAADCVRIYDASTGHFLRNLVTATDQIDRPIQFCDMIFAGTLQASLSRQNPEVLMAQLGWHLVTTVLCTSPVGIRMRSFVTMPKTVDHPPSHSSRTWRIIPSF